MSELPAVADCIPHRGEWLLIERITAMTETTISSLATFTPEQVEGHFPGQPVVPGVLLLEALAQTMACLHVQLQEEEGGTPFLAGFEKVRFQAPVLPPATCTFDITLKEQRFGLTTASGVVKCNGRKVCQARLTGAILPDAEA